MTAITAEGMNLRPSSSNGASAETRPGPIGKLAAVLAERKVHRVQLDLPPRSMERLNKLKDATEASSYAEVVRNAMKLYEAMFHEAQAGRQFLIKDPSGTITPYPVFLEA